MLQRLIPQPLHVHRLSPPAIHSPSVRKYEAAAVESVKINTTENMAGVTD